ncbi:MAG: hypothetical protein L3K15_04185 [Thermoplasmata archaeon]|nr:hypothetical protein [Thermoplasmata archaeon]
MASRTDRGVGARGNAIALTSELPGVALLRALNGIAPDLYFTAAMEVETTYSPRRAVRRWYRYVEAAAETKPSVVGAWRDVARCFRGRIDVRSFGRRQSWREPIWRDIDSFEVTERPGHLLLDLRAPSFVWGMVRKIVAAGRAVTRGNLALDRLQAAVAGTAPLGIPLAEPEPLILWAVEYDRPWTVAEKRPTREQITHWSGELYASRSRVELLGLIGEELLARGTPAGPASG